MKLITFKYKDGMVLSNEWCEILDGKWPYGNLDEKIIIKDFDFYNND